jgi:hypothetical protein
MGTTNYADFKIPELPAAVEITQDDDEDHGPF